ncbi:MAG: hypothetical protein ABEI52_06940 [Halobacteriaceae archaeon]
MTTTTVSETTFTEEDGTERTQYRTTVPKQLAESFDLAGATIQWEIQTGNSILIRKVENE